MIGKIRVIAIAITILGISLILSAHGFATEITVVGHVNEMYQIVAEDGQIYEVEENEVGNELVENNVGKKVRISGEVKEVDDIKMIRVSFYEVLEK